MHRLFSDVNPSLLGTSSEEAIEEARMLKNFLSTSASPDEPPFILRSLVPDTKYSASESRRLEGARAKLETDLFRVFDIREPCGDRLLMVGSLPSDS